MGTLNCLIAGLVFANTQAGTAISLNFSQTDVSQVFRAIGMRTGANIVYSAQDKLPITVHIDATTVEEAVRGAASAAGLSYRKTGRFYVAAKPESLRQALEPFFQKAKLESPGNAEEMAKRIEAALPHAKAAASGPYLLIQAIPEDMAQAREIIADRQRELAGGPADTQVIRLASAPADKVGQVLTTLFPNVKTTVILSAKDGGGTLTLTGSTSEVAQARKQAESLDLASATPVEEAAFKTYDIHYASASQLKEFLGQAMPNVQVLVAPGSTSPAAPQFRSLTGASLVRGQGGGEGGGGSEGGDQGAGGGGGAAGGAKSQWATTDANNDRSRKLVLRGRVSELAEAIRLLESVDVRPQQVKIDVQVIDASPSNTDNRGIRWDWASLQFEELPSGTGYTGNDGGSSPWRTGATRDVGFGMFSRIPWRVAAFLQGEIVNRRAKLLANPNIQVIDNDDASVFIGDTLRVSVAQAGSLGAQTVEVVEFNVGIILALRPRINSNGDVTMMLNPAVSTVTGTVGGLPQTATREARTTVVLKDGETMAIGGLIRDEEIRTMRKIPILGDLPFLGELFKNTTTEKRGSNVVVLVTPHIVRDGDAVKPAEVKKQ